jgi:alpha-ribazole phosphatase
MARDEHESTASAARPISSIRSVSLGHYRSLLVAVQFLTRLPTPCVAMGDEAERALILGRSAAYFPLVGALIGATTGATIRLAGQFWPIGLAVVIGLAFEALLTGAFHEDAVADFCDAFGGGWTRDDILRILKDSRLGSFGALGLILAVALRGSAVHRDGDARLCLARIPQPRSAGDCMRGHHRADRRARQIRRAAARGHERRLPGVFMLCVTGGCALDDRGVLALAGGGRVIYSDLILVRHARVAGCYRGICYGRSDVPLGPDGIEESARLAEIMSGWPIRHLITSGAARTRALTERIAGHTGLPMTIEPALLERDFGRWEMRSWDAIYEEVGDALSGLIHEPETFRPPGGETTGELRDRVLSWHERRPRSGLTVVVAHGGPIAAIRGTLAGKAPVDWVTLIPQPGEWITLAGCIGERAHISEGSGIE